MWLGKVVILLMKKRMLFLMLIPLLTACTNSEQEVKDESETNVQHNTAIYSENASLLTGEEVSNVNGQHFSVMIENSPEARPQTGLSSADIVYEIKTEGNISRYLAFFHDNIPSSVGPVRSSRHYFIPLSEQLNFTYVHFGASTYAYEYLQSSKLKVPHIDGITDSKYFFRDNTRNAPHNAYLNTESLVSYDDLIITNEMFSFGDSGDLASETANSIEFSYNKFTNIRYTYDHSMKKYLRFQESIPHVDAKSQEQIMVSNVIIQYTIHDSIAEDNLGRIDVVLTGEGEIDYFTEGKKMKGTWRKGNNMLSTTFYDSNGQPLNLNPGNTWIQVLDVDNDLKFN